MKGFERMREMKINHGLHRLASLTLAMLGMVWAANAATGTSAEFRMDLSGMGSWEMRTARASEAISYSSAWATNALDGANAVVKVWPVKREKPKYIAIDLSGGTTATHYPIEYLDEIPGGTWSDEYKTAKLVLRHIPAGSFIMGGRATDYPGAVNTNLHMVTLTKDFYIGVFEVTQRQWELVMGNRPSAFTNEACYATRPVEYISHNDMRGNVLGTKWPDSKQVDADSFIGKMRVKSGVTGFDLPTEAQWEYACRAGTTTALNTGKNITDSLASCPNVEEAARYSGNSNVNLVEANTTKDMDFDLEVGTAEVGSYLPNNWGIYDMHGNVWEQCLDCSSKEVCGSVDPVGSTNNSWRLVRGGGYRNSGLYLYSGLHHLNERGNGNTLSWQANDKGFRLCLQGGEIPETTAGTVLVNAAGEGTANWTPTKTGTYYLTHETQTNGVNGAEVLGAWFEVVGPELKFTLDGDLVPGVKVAIDVAGEGWTVRYEVGGGAMGSSRPTSESPEYTGPITLNDSQTIRAIAFSDGGLASREFSATYSLMSIGSAVAKPRYPWNGKVDIDCEVKGDANLEYLVSLSALDLDGNTNLPVRTVSVATERDPPANGVSGGRFLVKPGTYRFTWDADADIAGDFDFANVAVKVSAEGSAIIAAKKVLPLQVAGYTGTEVLTNVPVLVRLSTAISGFSYADFADANGGDLMFTDESGSVVYPHEIDEWHVGGESLVWVKLPEMKQGTKFKLAYGNPNYSLSTITSSLSPHEVWRDYAGVWHMNEDAGTAFDSTAHGLDALPSCGTNKLADVSQMIAYENGACGRARVNSTTEQTSNNQWMKYGNYMMVPSYDALNLGGQFVISGWVHGNINMPYPRFASRKRDNFDAHGWEVVFCAEGYENNESLTVHGAGESATVIKDVHVDISDINSGWVYLTCVFDGAVVQCYNNGEIAATGEILPATDNGLPLAFGQKPSATSTGYCGQYDEIRLRGGALSADRIKADYDMIKNRNFLTYGPVESGRGAE